MKCGNTVTNYKLWSYEPLNSTDLVFTSKIVLSLSTCVWQTFGDYPMYHGVVCQWIFHVFYALYGSVVHVRNLLPFRATHLITAGGCAFNSVNLIITSF